MTNNGDKTPEGSDLTLSERLTIALRLLDYGSWPLRSSTILSRLAEWVLGKDDAETLLKAVSVWIYEIHRETYDLNASPDIELHCVEFVSCETGIRLDSDTLDDFLNVLAEVARKRGSLQTIHELASVLESMPVQPGWEHLPSHVQRLREMENALYVSTKQRTSLLKNAADVRAGGLSDIISKENLGKLHNALHGKKNKTAIQILRYAYEQGWFQTLPKFPDVAREFGDICSQQNFSKYINIGLTSEEKKYFQNELG